MDLASLNIIVKGAASTMYCTYTEVELLHKRRLEAEGAAVVYKTLQRLHVSENESKKRARDQVSLRS